MELKASVKWGVVEKYLDSLLPELMAFFTTIILAIVVYFIGSRIIKFFMKTYERWAEKREIDEGVRQFLGSLVKAILYMILVFVILTLFGVTTASVVAVLGSAGLTLGLALQGSLSNFAGGVIILIMKPFKVGDYIIEDTHKNEGTVEEISLFYTKLSTRDNRSVMIPNGILANSSMTNVTSNGKRRIDLSVGISYQSDIRQAKEVLLQVVFEESACLSEEEMLVFVSNLADSSIVMGVRVWVHTEDYWQTRWRLLENIKYAFDENGIEIPYPQMDVTIRQ
ncbi:MAG: mechanosensitive ion channel [Lachnospiraceae bacterium]|nr:mechanosensitive ion channel [Lachnospiraceae bacterium]